MVAYQRLYIGRAARASRPHRSQPDFCGYPGTAQIRLAVESREVDGLCWSWETVHLSAKH